MGTVWLKSEPRATTDVDFLVTSLAGVADALAAEGRRTLLMEVEGRQGIAQLFDSAPLPYEERRVARAPDGGEVRHTAYRDGRPAQVSGHGTHPVAWSYGVGRWVERETARNRWREWARIERLDPAGQPRGEWETFYFDGLGRVVAAADGGGLPARRPQGR